MAIYCPIINSKVTYMYCQECDDKICEKETINDTEKSIKEGEKNNEKN